MTKHKKTLKKFVYLNPCRRIITEKGIASYSVCRFSLFLKDPFSRLFRGRNSCHCFCVGLVKFLPMHQYSVDIFSNSDPLGILGSDGTQNTT